MFANGGVLNSIGPACSARTEEVPSPAMTRTYRRSDASPESKTTRASLPVRPSLRK